MFTFLLSSVNLTSVWRIFNNKFKIPIWRRFEISGFSLKVSHLKLVGKPGSCPKLGTDMFFCVSVWNMNLLCQLNFSFYLRFMFYFSFLPPFFFSFTKTSQKISSFTFIKDNFCFSMLFDTFNLPHFSDSEILHVFVFVLKPGKTRCCQKTIYVAKFLAKTPAMECPYMGNPEFEFWRQNCRIALFSLERIFE